MTRLPQNRDTHLSSGEIAAEALRQFDQAENEPSIRSLAAALRVAPSAIYHHYPSRSAIVQAAVERVWDEATAGLLQLVPKPFEEDPREVLVATGIASRRAWLSHYRLSPYMAANPRVDEFTRDALGLMANLFERLGLTGEEAATAFHSYSSFMIGSVLFAAARKAANEQLMAGQTEGEDEGAPRFKSVPTPAMAQRSAEQTRRSLDAAVELSAVDPTRDEKLYVEGLRRLVESLTRTG